MTTETDLHDLLAYPPIPLATGDLVRHDSSGAVQAVAGLSLHITGADGGTSVVHLEHRHGGWWVPDVVRGLNV